MTRADAHQCDQEPSADEESRNTVAVIGGRGEAWSTAHKRPKSEKVRSRARCRASPIPSSQCTAATGEALGHPRAMESQVELLKGGRIVSDELKTKGSAREDIGDENGRDTRHWPGERDDPRGSTESRREGAKRESGGEDNAQAPVLLDQRQGNATKVNTAVRAAAQRTANTPGMHGIEGHLKVSLGGGA